MMRDELNYWSADDFEKNVAATLIACYESKVKKNRGAPPGDRLNDRALQTMRSMGPYIPSPSRLILWDDAYHEFDIRNDTLPTRGCVALPCADVKRKSLEYTGYLDIFMFRRRAELPKPWVCRSSGAVFEMYCMYPNDDRVHGERTVFVVDNTGRIVGCDQVFPNIARGQQGRRTQSVRKSDVEPEILKQTEAAATVALQYTADRFFSWCITAEERTAKAHLGCMREEVKSLLYARSLPITSTGRKRPILHLVAAHKRRVASGIDIDITSFLRGSCKVEMEGTLFTVRPPESIKGDVSKRSQEVYFDASQAV